MITSVIDYLLMEASVNNRKPIQFKIGEPLRKHISREIEQNFLLNFRLLEQKDDKRDVYKGVPVEYFVSWFGIELITEPII